MKALQLISITKTYESGNLFINVLDDINLTIYPNEFVSIIGSSGSGKTTLLNVISGLENPDSGRVIINETDFTDFNDEERAKFRLKNIGFVFQNYNLIPVINVLENIILPAKLDGRKIDINEVTEIAKILEIEDKLYQMPNLLSGGQQQRVAIARTLYTKPAIVLADEPTGNLDSKTSANVIQLMKRMSQKFGQTMIVVTHDNKVAEAADRVIQIEDGKIVSDGK
ncbi:putative ABC transport system ATP-binding protein [Lacrimispora xylanisolvens]|uniref:Putative ABC transport system ATP-binding protein n=1 Tax=Lacrimispora xylanisolvens TaxID=384636 RepID=A0A2S6HWE5_9FIRM|nr:ABC transporter ATP-binding protein [Hungatella xylanolytica]PPK82331.1 putative ABC transport system ATP-binding protein [Hungatella xylanolytica]